MRVVGGRLRGRAIVAPTSQAIRPTADRLRETLFNILMHGYAGSLEGTAFKLCNDLYYVKHHSISLDIAILLETLRTLVADKQYIEPPSTSLTMLGESEGRAVGTPDKTSASTGAAPVR